MQQKAHKWKRNLRIINKSKEKQFSLPSILIYYDKSVPLYRHKP
ncbi:hypothetical protein HMPREF9442_02672 [Paraprevotella xylaniphila YIT 11841]|uniref:Uncharacterized protein n=1 Tax=Paraprevotella xylaniphila YIT 11841 TaxID=762982 RepID=F3QWU0_9BACT|nr:hypothetical protein HMPREF9442_02672 [Paraprevotella xylaniphila YIT 11841]